MKKIKIFQGYASNWTEEKFVIKKVKIIVPWADVLENPNGEKIGGTCYEKKSLETNQI